MTFSETNPNSKYMLPTNLVERDHVGRRPVTQRAPAAPCPLRAAMVQNALTWQATYGVAPSITSTISEYDVALLMGHTPQSYAQDCVGRTAVTKGSDFTINGLRVQVKAARPSKDTTAVTIVAHAHNYDWDVLVWVRYNARYELQEAWVWAVSDYRAAFEGLDRLTPKDMRRGTCAFLAETKGTAADPRRGVSPQI